MRSKIKLFNVYIKSKFAHLIPMIALTGNLELTWKNIRSTIFRDLLERKTIPRETCTILGLSFYSIIIKPILKLLNKEHIKADNDMINFYIEAMKNIFKTWLKVEPNNTEKIKQYIDELLTNNTLKSIDEFEEEIYNQAAIRLHRNKTIPEKVKNLSKANMPRLLELTSNAPQHLIEEVIRQKIIDSEDIQEETIGKMIHEQILGYITINQTLECEIPKIEKPNQENIKDILEYQQLYDLKIEIIVDKKFEEIETQTKQMINKIIKSNQYNKSKIPKIPIELLETMEKTRDTIPAQGKNKWLMEETILEKIVEKYKLNFINTKIKKKPGRPKKNNENNNNLQNKIEKFFK